VPSPPRARRSIGRASSRLKSSASWYAGGSGLFSRRQSSSSTDHETLEAIQGLAAQSIQILEGQNKTEVGHVRRAGAAADARGIVVAPTDGGVARLTETAPVHARGISDLFVARLNDHELVAFESALAKVTIDCTVG
jgi:hypothetical protein